MTNQRNRCQQRHGWLPQSIPIVILVALLMVHCATSLSLSTMKAKTSPSLAQRFLDRVRNNNQAGDASTVPFLVGGKQLGNVLPQAVHVFSQYPTVFSITKEGLQLVDPRNSSDWERAGGNADECNLPIIVQRRSHAVNEVLLDIRRKQIIPALLGWRDEPFAVRESFHSPPDLIIERAGAVLFGVPAYGVFLNGYTVEHEKTNIPFDVSDDTAAAANVHRHHRRPTHIWIGRRSPTKPTWPGRWDSLAAGGLAAGMMPLQAIMKECKEEAGIDILKPQAVSAVSYTSFNEDGWGLKRDVLFCFDLELPVDFIPVPVDGEMESFEKIPIDNILEFLATPVLPDDSNNAWKPNVAIVLIDFCVRHGFVDVDDPAFLELIGALRGAKCA